MWWPLWVCAQTTSPYATPQGLRLHILIVLHVMQARRDLGCEHQYLCISQTCDVIKTAMCTKEQEGFATQWFIEPIFE